MKNILDIIESFLKSVGLIVGAFWVYRKFIRTREDHPKIEVEINLKVIGRIETKVIIEIMVNLQNKGLVRHMIQDFNLDISIQKNNIELKPRITNKQLIFENYDSFAGFIMDGSTDIGKQQNYIDAGIKQQYTFLIDMPENTQFITAFCRFKCEGDEHHTLQRTFSLSESEKKNECKDK